MYTPWGALLNKELAVFEGLLVQPQFTFLYKEGNRDKEQIKRLTPDFLINLYETVSKAIKYRTIITFEIKRRGIGVKDTEVKRLEAITQMIEQVDALFTNTDNEKVIGMIAVGDMWQYFVYSKYKKDHKKYSRSNESYKPFKEDKITNK